ncbi:50S ribosomal protein L23 [Candidatus Mikella endobia]|uniref:Large ribosomal subunit protein uL23 n=1 Tax=Candidatus Mikella endobia TaxID=1778264 RepID=A0A143WPT0_9ENTR|nr:50S ribosomal protein L23 [Candidatus Mikella endobia]CUX95738.1 50S ribosomal protein L23 [Candidatus Mikella endobia]
MICEEYLLKLLRTPHISEKVSTSIKKYNTIVFNVTKNSNKIEIKSAIQKIFKVKVHKIHTLIVKGKRKRHKQYMGYRSNWKKAYILLKQDQKIESIGKSELF